MTLLAKTASWFTGTNQNVAGRENFVKPLVWAGGNPAYRDICAEVARNRCEDPDVTAAQTAATATRFFALPTG